MYGSMDRKIRVDIGRNVYKMKLFSGHYHSSKITVRGSVPTHFMTFNTVLLVVPVFFVILVGRFDTFVTARQSSSVSESHNQL